MAKKSGFAVNVEYGALRLACGLVNAIPYPVAMWLASFVAAFAVRVLRFKRARTMERIASVFPEKTKPEQLRIAVRSLANVLQTAVEMIRAPRLTRKWMDRHVVDGQMYKDRLQAYVDEGKGVVIMVPHSGNWYMAAWAMAAYGLPLFAIISSISSLTFSIAGVSPIILYLVFTFFFKFLVSTTKVDLSSALRNVTSNLLRSSGFWM